MSENIGRYARLLEARQTYEERVRKELGVTDERVIRDLMIEVVEKMTGYEIVLKHVNWNSQFIKSRLERYDCDQRAEIVVATDLNHCWRSYVVAKELAHLLFDCADHSCVSTSKEAIRMIEAILSDQAFGKISPGNVKEAAISEKVMLIGAAELLFPFDKAVEYGRKVEADELTSFHVANIFKIPTIYVERLTSPDLITAWHQLLKAVRDEE